MIKEVNKFLSGITKLWQCKNEKYENMKVVGIYLIIFAVICFVISQFLNNDNPLLNYIAKYTFIYMEMLMILIALNCLLFYWYVYNKIKYIKNCANFFMILILLLLGITLMIGIPFVLLLGILGKILEYRAKKIDNLLSFIIYFALTLTVVAILIIPNYIIAYYISTIFKDILFFKFRVNLDIFSIELFIFISIIKLEIDNFYKILILIKKMKLNKNIHESMRITEIIFRKNINTSNFDLEIYMKDKENKIKEMEDSLKKKVDYDINYLKNTMKKVELAILIIFFIIVVLKIVPYELLDDLNKYQSDTINVLTIYTLAMLYIDKRREWK